MDFLECFFSRLADIPTIYFVGLFITLFLTVVIVTVAIAQAVKYHRDCKKFGKEYADRLWNNERR